MGEPVMGGLMNKYCRRIGAVIGEWIEKKMSGDIIITLTFRMGGVRACHIQQIQKEIIT